MNTYKLELTEIEEYCGVTLEEVAEVLPKVLVRNDQVFLPEHVGPALAGAVARCALAGPVEFVGINTLRQPIYRPATEEVPNV